MTHSLQSLFGNSFERVERAVSDLQKGKGVLLVDDEDRENQGDLVLTIDDIAQYREKALSKSV